MEIKRFLQYILVMGLVILLLVGLTACNRSVSEGPASLATVDTSGTIFPVPGAGETEQAMPGFEEAMTATAIAEAILIPGAEKETPPLAVTATPKPTTTPKAAQEQASKPKATEEEKKLPKTYTIQKGEFPFCIARRFNVNQNELLSINGLTVNSQVPVGYVLKIPQTGNHFITDRALKDHPTTYTVKSGETIYTIACAFGDVSPEAIIEANDLKKPYTLKTGQKLQIP